MERRTFLKTAADGDRSAGDSGRGRQGGYETADRRKRRLTPTRSITIGANCPKTIAYGNTHGVVEDSQGHIYVHHTVNAASESADSMVVFDGKGKFVKSWGREFKGGAHGLHIRKEGSTEFLYLCDTARGVIVKATLDGETVWSVGYPDQSEAYKPGADGKKPKWSPTNLAIAPERRDLRRRRLRVELHPPIQQQGRVSANVRRQRQGSGQTRLSARHHRGHARRDARS